MTDNAYDSEGLAQYTLTGLEHLAQDDSLTTAQQAAVTQEAQRRLTEQANTAYDQGAR